MAYGKYILFVLFSCSILNSCSILEPAPPAASFIHIDTISVITDYPTQGSRASKVTDAWVIYDNAFLGTFPLPANFPLLGEGNHRIQIKAGIIENGIASTRSAYPKYGTFDTTINLVANHKTTLTPNVTYAPGAVFPQLEDFDDASLSLTTANSSYAQLQITQTGDPEAFENNSGFVILDSNHPTFEDASSTAFPLPLNVPTYLELNYKCENEFRVGMYVSTAAGVVKTELLTINPTAVWKKIYVSLSDLGGINASGIEYKIYLRADLSGSLSTAKLYFDNLKIVY